MKCRQSSYIDSRVYAIAILFLAASNVMANDHDLDPPKVSKNPYITGLGNSRGVAGGAIEAEEQLKSDQNPSRYIDLSKPVDLPTSFGYWTQLQIS
jgi:hypothetical protein